LEIKSRGVAISTVETPPEPNGTALSILLPSTYIFSCLVAWYRQEGMRLWLSFDGPRLDSIRALADPMRPYRAVERL
jgi:hypothetical protein